MSGFLSESESAKQILRRFAPQNDMGHCIK